MSSKLSFNGLKTFKEKIDAKFSLKGHTHSNYVTQTEFQSAVNSINEIVTFTKALTLSTSWQDIGISGTDLATGSYMVQLSNVIEQEIWTGIMSWYSGDTTDTTADEIVLHQAGDYSAGIKMYLRVIRTSDSKLKMQYACSSTALNGQSVTATLKFKKII